MIANLSPSETTYEDTYNTLKYADRAKNITVTCKRNLFSEDLSEEVLKSQLIELQTKVRDLSKKLKAGEIERKESTRDESTSNPNLGMGDSHRGMSSLLKIYSSFLMYGFKYQSY